MPDDLERFAEFCAGVLTDPNGRPLRLYPEQMEMIRDYFDGCRETLILAPKKAGKSGMIAALALHHLLVTPFAECFIVARARDQAGRVLEAIAGYVHRSPELSTRVRVKQREVVHDGNRGLIRVLAADVDTADGVTPTLALVDELHRAKSVELYQVMRAGLGPRNGRMVTISTAGDRADTPLGELRAKAYELVGLVREGARRYVRQGDSFSFTEYALDDDADVHDMESVKLANPAPWVTLEELQERHDSPSMTDWAWRRFACGQWIEGEFSAFQALEWARCTVETLELPEEARGPYWGLDLGWKYDTTSMTPVWILGGSWVEEKIPVRARDGRQLFRREWRRDTTPERAYVGEPVILTPPGDGTSLPAEVIWQAIVDVQRQHPEAVWVADPLAGGEQLVQRIDSELGARVIVHSQANTPMIRASQRLQEMIASGRLVHTGDSGLNAHVMACGVRQVGEGWRIQKQPGSKGPIDAAVALAMALSAGLDDVGEEPPKPRSGVTLGFA